MAKALSQTQADVVEALQTYDRPLVRLAGGFWTYEGCDEDRPGVPGWWVTIATVRALERAGWLERTHTFTEEWRDSRRLVAGRV